MSTTEQRKEAELLREQLLDRNAMPSSLRMPLGLVIEGTEAPGTASMVLVMARDALAAQPAPLDAGR